MKQKRSLTELAGLLTPEEGQALAEAIAEARRDRLEARKRRLGL